MFDQVVKFGKAAVLFAAVAALVAAAIAALAVRDALDVLPATVEAAIVEQSRVLQETISWELEATRTGARIESAEYRRLLRSELANARTAAIGESAAWREMARDEIGGVRRDVRAEMRAAVQLADERLYPVTAAAERTIETFGSVPAQVGAELAPYWNCRGNGACWPAQTTALLGAARVTAGRTSMAMRAWEAATPSIVGNVDRTAANVERLTRPASLIERILRIAAPAAGGAVMGVLK